MSLVLDLVTDISRDLLRDTIDAVASYRVTLTGLTDREAALGDYASIGFTTNPLGGVITQKWGSTAGGSEFGTGASPTDYDAATGGVLHLEVTRDGEIVRASVKIEAQVADAIYANSMAVYANSTQYQSNRLQIPAEVAQAIYANTMAINANSTQHYVNGGAF